jgi:hypothetical protein
MRGERPLYVAGIAVLIVGFAVGIAFPDVSVSEMLSGLAVLACLVLTLYTMIRHSGHAE